jgi:hypothetical protein
MAIIPIARSAGTILGALLGGSLASLKITGGSHAGLLHRFPYILPSGAAALFPAATAIIVALFLPEVRSCFAMAR